MAGTLYVVGTPIGNLKDITYRAVETLSSVDVIACEDTRVSLKLLSYYNVKKPLISYYKQKEREGSEKIISRLKDGKNVALITDAGMPCVSDPGAILVSECRKAGLKVEIVPGASAVVSAVALAGITSRGFTFLGFLPEKRKDKEELVKDFKFSSEPVVFYVSPHEINDDAKFLYESFGERQVFVVHELTKMFESVEEQNLSSFSIPSPKGEYVLIVMPSTGRNALNDLSIADHVRHYMQSGMTKKDAIKRTASDRNVDKNTVYSEVLDL